MTHHRLARSLALAAATLTGLGLFCLGLHTVSAQAPAAAPAAAQTWLVNNSPGDGLVGYWKFDNLADGASLNSAQLTNSTVLSGGAVLTATVSPSLTVPDTHSLLLDGGNDAAVVSDSAQLDVAPAAFSVAAWVRRATTGTYDALYDSGTQTNKWWLFIASTNLFGFGIRDITETYSTRAITDTAWHHLAVVVNGTGAGNLTFYVDGVPSGVRTVTNVLAPSGSKRIGALSDGVHGLNAFFGGSLDEVRLYNRALSALEVGRLAAGRGCATDGLTWPTAFQDLQCALDVARGGDQIWVAAGAYRPGADRSVPFRLFGSYSLFGGFTGLESSLAQRPPFNPAAPLTVLSGDAAANDTPGSDASLGDNSCNVVMVGSLGIPGGGFSAALDGLAIQQGNADSGCAAFPASASGGGLASVMPSRLAVSSVVFRANRASVQGGGLFQAAGQLTLTSASFLSNTALSGGIGGGLAIAGGSLTLTAASFVSNTASLGGALSIHPGASPFAQPITVTISSASFTRNTAQDGGAVEAQIGDRLLDLSFDQAHFSNNTSTGGDGGALSLTGFATGTVRTRISNSTFTSNTANEDGGAISDFGDQLIITASQFSANAAPNSAGGALETNSSAVTVTNTLFFSNTARSGGALSSFASTLALADSQVIQNQALDPGLASDFAPIGGGVFVNGTALVTNTQFLSNTAFLQGLFMDENLAGGGGLAVQGSLQLSGGAFQGNTARQGGGAQVIGSAVIQGVLFQGNTAGQGGGLFADGNLSLLSSRLIHNIATLDDATNQPGVGGGLFLQNGGLSNRISNNLFLGNQALSASANAPSGAALSLDSFSALVSNNTIVSHQLITTSAASLSGTIGLFNNLITSHSVAIQSLSGLTFDDYNLFSGDTLTATGVISALGHSRLADPRFVAPALDDFRLRLNSPAIDAGDNNRVPNTVTTDLSGGPRFVNVPSVPDTGAGSPPLVDIGAYEVNDQLFLPLLQR